MNKRHIFLLVSILVVFVQLGVGQTNKKSVKALNFPSLQKQADEMANAFKNEDYQLFSYYMYPAVLGKLGGKEKFIEFTKTSMDELKSQGLVIEDYSILKVTQILHEPKHIFGVLQTQMKAKMNDKPVTSIGSIVGVSVDKGKNWKFIRVESKEILKSFFPRLVNKLKIPPDIIS